MKKTIYAFLIFYIALFAISCDSSDKDSPFETCPSGKYDTVSGITAHDGCKSLYTRSITEFVELKTINKFQLKIKHIDAMLNCEPGKIGYNCQAGEGIVTINEREESTAANCACLYDLEYTITLPQYGTYKLVINSYEFGEFEFTASTDAKLYKRLTPQNSI